MFFIEFRQIVRFANFKHSYKWWRGKCVWEEKSATFEVRGA